MTPPADPVAILKKRRLPAIAVLNDALEVVWLSGDAAALMALPGEVPQGESEPGTARTLGDVAREVAGRLLGQPLDSIDFEAVEADVVAPEDGPVYGLRAAYLVSADTGPGAAPMVIVHIDTVALEREIDFDAVRRRYGISRREQDVLRLLYFGKGNREIGELLFISEYTVKDHLKAIMAKMEASSRAEVLYKLATAA
jgi:DNA-binding CsgD family transcriptional regulator